MYYTLSKQSMYLHTSVSVTTVAELEGAKLIQCTVGLDLRFIGISIILLLLPKPEVIKTK